VTIAILAPVFVQVALTFGLLFWMGSLRIRALQEQRLHISDIALGEPNWPQRATQIQRAYENQFELPVLFYVLVALALATGRVTEALVVLASAFVVARLAHAFIHTTSNAVPARFWAYCVGVALLVAMWLWFLWRMVWA
jgi:hypothetical protein